MFGLAVMTGLLFLKYLLVPSGFSYIFFSYLLIQVIAIHDVHCSGVDYLMGANEDLYRQVKYFIKGKQRKAVVTVDMKEVSHLSLLVCVASVSAIVGRICAGLVRLPSSILRAA